MTLLSLSASSPRAIIPITGYPKAAFFVGPYSCDQSLEKILRANYAEDAVFRAEKIILHPEYVKGKRDQADIALIEVDREIQFVAGKVGPICLPGPRFRDSNTKAQVLGWGLLYEEDMDTMRLAGCLTNGVGPEKFEPCRRRFLHQGEMMIVNQDWGCIPDNPPVTLK